MTAALPDAGEDELTGAVELGMSECGRAHRNGPSPAPEGAVAVFGPRLSIAQSYVRLLATSGAERGVIGPREAPRLWERHILNCAVVEELVPLRQEVIDVGSGAGLPGLALAIARPDLQLYLVEPMRRRTEWLTEVLHNLKLTNVEVIRARAEHLHGRLSAPFVMARAVAALDPLARWCLPLLTPGGSLLALRGREAVAEAAALKPTLSRLGALHVDTLTVGCERVTPPTTVVRVVAGSLAVRAARAGGRPAVR